ncbi:MAG TPA: lipoprotein insertase outer membrane protein LolB [Burkholderiales bacterium]|nr:lipoprotein insertase outer membrane protein LolB [Burkholderiales bacterium]
MRRRFAVWVLCGAAAVLAGCASAPPARHLPATSAGIDAFSLAGRVAFRIDDRGDKAGLSWRHREERDSLRLLSPLGSVVGEIEADASGAVLTTSDKKVHRAPDVQSLTREALGWDLPLSGLRYWVVGRPDPAVPVQAEARDDRQRLVSLEQDGWRVTYLGYFGDSALPARMNLDYGRLQLRLIVERWDLPP